MSGARTRTKTPCVATRTTSKQYGIVCASWHTNLHLRGIAGTSMAGYGDHGRPPKRHRADEKWWMDYVQTYTEIAKRVWNTLSVISITKRLVNKSASLN